MHIVIVALIVVKTGTDALDRQRKNSLDTRIETGTNPDEQHIN